MASLLIESFANCAVGDFASGKWTSLTPYDVGTSYGRLGGYGVQINGGNGLEYNIPSAPTTIIVGGAYNFQVHAGRMQIADSSGNHQIALRYSADTSLLSILNYSDTVLASYTLSANTFNYIEVKVVISTSTTGSVTVNINGANIAPLTLSGIKTSNTLTTAGQISFTGDSGGNYYYLADVYINDNSGSYNNDFLGDSKVLPSRASANGDVNNFTIGGSSPAATNYQSINERTPDYGVTYVYDATVNDVDLYAYSSPSGLNSITALQVSAMLKKDDVALRQVQIVMKLSGTEYFSPTFTLSTSYQYYVWVQNVNPATSLPWVVGDYTGVQFGLKVIT